MDGDKLRDLHAEVNGIAGQARDDINRLQSRIDALQSRPAPIFKPEGGPSVAHPLTGEEKRLREDLKEQISNREKEAKTKIEEAIDKGGNGVSERDKAFIRSDAYAILGGREDFLRNQISKIPVAEQSRFLDRWSGRNDDGRSPSSHTTNQEKAPERIQPGNLPDKGRVSEEFNSGAAKRGGYRSGPGKDEGPDAPKVSPEPPGTAQGKLTDRLKGSKFVRDMDQKAASAKDAPEQAPVQQSTMSDRSRGAQALANRSPDAEKSQESPKTPGESFSSRTKGSMFLSKEAQDRLEKARQQKGRGPDRDEK